MSLGSADLKGTFDVGQNSADLKATFDVGQDSRDLFADLTVRQEASQDLYAELVVRQSGAEDLYAKFELQDSEDLFAEFIVRQTGTADLFAEVIIVQSGSVNLYAKARITLHFSGKPANLFAKLFVGVDAFEELYAKFETQGVRDLFAKFTVRHSAFADLFNQFRVIVHFGEGWADLAAEMLIVRFDSADLPAEFIIRQSGSSELFSETIIRHSASEEVFAEAVIRHDGSADLKGIITIRHDATADLKATVVIRHTGTPLNLFAKFIAVPNEDLFAKFTIRHTTSRDLLGFFYIRHPYWLWTTRRYINGVVDLSETLLGDAKLEYVIEGVMEDIQGFLEANDLTYDEWTNIITVPTLIRRATTYGTVAALYARNSRTFRSRVIPTAAPITVTVIGDDERAMQHWETKMKDALGNYLAARQSIRIWVSTADEEPIFSMADIPATAEDDLEWHEWLQQRGA